MIMAIAVLGGGPRELFVGARDVGVAELLEPVTEPAVVDVPLDAALSVLEGPISTYMFPPITALIWLRTCSVSFRVFIV